MGLVVCFVCIMFGVVQSMELEEEANSVSGEWGSGEGRGSGADRVVSSNLPSIPPLALASRPRSHSSPRSTHHPPKSTHSLLASALSSSPSDIASSPSSYHAPAAYSPQTMNLRSAVAQMLNAPSLPIVGCPPPPTPATTPRSFKHKTLPAYDSDDDVVVMEGLDDGKEEAYGVERSKPIAISGGRSHMRMPTVSLVDVFPPREPVFPSSPPSSSSSSVSSSLASQHAKKVFGDGFSLPRGRKRRNTDERSVPPSVSGSPVDGFGDSSLFARESLSISPMPHPTSVSPSSFSSSAQSLPSIKSSAPLPAEELSALSLALQMDVEIVSSSPSTFSSSSSSSSLSHPRQRHKRSRGLGDH